MVRDASSKGAKLIEKEVAETGSVGFDVYGYYLRNVGLFGSVVGILMQLVYQGTSIGTNYWLNVWTDGTLGNSSIPAKRDMYLGVYGALGALQA